jgi:hypothetical protein
MAFFHYKIIRNTIIQFLDIFNNIQCARINQTTGEIIKYITVPVKLAPRDKIYSFVQDKKNAKILPMISAQISSLTHDPSRMTNKNFMVEGSTNNNSIDRYLNPAPYNIDMNVSIITNYLYELDQIIEQVLSYFNPYIFIRIKIPELDENFSYELKVLLQSCSFDTSADIDASDYRICSAQLAFTLHMYLYTPKEETALVNSIITKYYTNETVMDAQSGTETMFTSGASGYEKESVLLTPLGYDESGVILARYEIFPGELYNE